MQFKTENEVKLSWIVGCIRAGEKTIVREERGVAIVSSFLAIR
jgi:hypothetical protein